MDFKLRHEESKDIEQVREILRAAFPMEAESKLVDALRANDKRIIALVAANDDWVLGHILFSPVTTTPPSKAKGIGLAPVAVLPEVQLQGIGSGLIREGLRLCKELGYDYCVVLGNPKYYQRFGFEKASSFCMQNEYGLDDAFMVIRFSNCGDMAYGLVKYASEFALFSL
jgi:Predicted acetyltransferase